MVLHQPEPSPSRTVASVHRKLDIVPYGVARVTPFLFLLQRKSTQQSHNTCNHSICLVFSSQICPQSMFRWIDMSIASRHICWLYEWHPDCMARQCVWRYTVFRVLHLDCDFQCPGVCLDPPKKLRRANLCRLPTPKIMRFEDLSTSQRKMANPDYGNIARTRTIVLLLLLRSFPIGARIPPSVVSSSGQTPAHPGNHFL